MTCEDVLGVIDSILSDEQYAGSEYRQLLGELGRIDIPRPTVKFIYTTINKITGDEKGHYNLVKAMRELLVEHCRLTSETKGQWTVGLSMPE